MFDLFIQTITTFSLSLYKFFWEDKTNVASFNNWMNLGDGDYYNNLSTSEYVWKFSK